MATAQYKGVLIVREDAVRTIIASMRTGDPDVPWIVGFYSHHPPVTKGLVLTVDDYVKDEMVQLFGLLSASNGVWSNPIGVSHRELPGRVVTIRTSTESVDVELDNLLYVFGPTLGSTRLHYASGHVDLNYPFGEVIDVIRPHLREQPKLIYHNPNPAQVRPGPVKE